MTLAALGLDLRGLGPEHRQDFLGVLSVAVRGTSA